MGRDLSTGIQRAYAERVDLLVVALTGRTGSGCTTAATAMSSAVADIPCSEEGLSEAEVRKHRICREFASTQWVSFKQITVSTVILSYLLTDDWSAVETFFNNEKLNAQVEFFKRLYDRLTGESNFLAFKNLMLQNDASESPKAWEFYVNSLSIVASEVRSELAAKYAGLFQTIGDNIRRSGSAISSSVDSRHVFSLIDRVKRLVKAACKWDRLNNNSSTRIVIDAVRNPLELVYLRDQFSAFFAIAITCDDEDRRSRLTERMSRREVDALDKREYSKKSLNSYDNFVSQNLQECIQKSDLFFHNPGKTESFAQNRLVLHRQIIRYVALMLRPGLVTPTSDERCMQLAFTAKLNSGCISRQVGAAVADSNSSIKAVGWNDVPKGQVPCLLRDVNTLLRGHDPSAFSDYEINNQKLRVFLTKKFENAPLLKTSTGLPCPYCFKDAYNSIENEKNQVHTRSLHAEENAFLQLAKYGGSGIVGGALYTTASPCELCSKKAFQLGIKTIVFVDPYPGISLDHILKSGRSDMRPELRLFKGAVGNAYHRLYESLLPIKDEYMALLNDDPAPTLI